MSYLYSNQKHIEDTARCYSSKEKNVSYSKNVSYAHENEIKKNDVKEAFIKVGLFDVKVSDLVASPSVTEYRNKAQYPISKDKNGEYVIGFYAPKSHRVTEARSCPLAPKIFSDILDRLAVFFKKYDLSVYDEERNGNGLRRKTDEQRNGAGIYLR